MSRGLIPSTGLQAYDQSRWSDWLPSAERALTVGPVSRLIQRVPKDARGASDTNVPANEKSLLFIFWSNGIAKLDCRIGDTGFCGPASPWSFAILPPNLDSWWVSSPTAAEGAVHVHLDASFVLSIAEEDGVLDPFSVLEPRANWVDAATAQYAMQILEEPETSPRLWWDTMATALVLRCMRMHRAATARPLARGGLPSYLLKRCQDYVFARLADEVSLSELAAIADLSPYHFCRAFKQSTGLPPHAWLTARRVERAQEMMLAHREMGLTEVALSVGYSTQAAFGVAFRRVTGATPGQWRRERVG